MYNEINLNQDYLSWKLIHCGYFIIQSLLKASTKNQRYTKQTHHIENRTKQINQNYMAWRHDLYGTKGLSLTINDSSKNPAVCALSTWAGNLLHLTLNISGLLVASLIITTLSLLVFVALTVLIPVVGLTHLTGNSCFASPGNYVIFTVNTN